MPVAREEHWVLRQDLARYVLSSGDYDILPETPAFCVPSLLGLERHDHEQVRGTISRVWGTRFVPEAVTESVSETMRFALQTAAAQTAQFEVNPLLRATIFDSLVDTLGLPRGDAKRLARLIPLIKAAGEPLFPAPTRSKIVHSWERLVDNLTLESNDSFAGALSDSGIPRPRHHAAFQLIAGLETTVVAAADAIVETISPGGQSTRALCGPPVRRLARVGRSISQPLPTYEHVALVSLENAGTHFPAERFQFGFGPHRCLGEQYAKAVVAGVGQAFESDRSTMRVTWRLPEDSRRLILRQPVELLAAVLR